jgi:hypothetical protein
MTHFKIIAAASTLGIITAAASAAAEPTGVEVASLDRPKSDAPAFPLREQAESRRKTSAFQLSLWDPVQTADADSAVHGMRLNLPYGVNRQLYGFDFGIASRTTGNVYGAQFGFVGIVERNFRGVQQGLFYSATEGQMNGWQHGIYGTAGRLRGLQSGLVNDVEGSARGAQIGAVNLAGGSSTGASIGVVNYSRRVTGLQLGLVNATSELRGVQIGLANFAPNGFLPFFPVINAAH